jgi:hypothetical protein
MVGTPGFEPGTTKMEIPVEPSKQAGRAFTYQDAGRRKQRSRTNLTGPSSWSLALPGFLRRHHDL